MQNAVPTPELRSQEILIGVRNAFAQKGFDGASMQDLARAAGMSVGNFYRYFPSKSAMVEAIIAQDIAEMEKDFSAILSAPDPMQILRSAIAQRVNEDLCKGHGSLWAEITATALRKPEIGDVVCRMEISVIGQLVSVFAQATGLPQDRAAQTFTDHATLIVMLIKASTIRAGFTPDGNPTALVLRMINQTLDEVMSFKTEG